MRKGSENLWIIKEKWKDAKDGSTSYNFKE